MSTLAKQHLQTADMNNKPVSLQIQRSSEILSDKEKQIVGSSSQKVKEGISNRLPEDIRAVTEYRASNCQKSIETRAGFAIFDTLADSKIHCTS